MLRIKFIWWCIFINKWYMAVNFERRLYYFDRWHLHAWICLKHRWLLASWRYVLDWILYNLEQHWSYLGINRIHSPWYIIESWYNLRYWAFNNKCWFAIWKKFYIWYILVFLVEKHCWIYNWYILFILSFWVFLGLLLGNLKTFIFSCSFLSLFLWYKQY